MASFPISSVPIFSISKPQDFLCARVQPFAIERLGTTFGLVPRSPEDKDDSWWVEMHPGNYMAFHEPWDSGEYDT